MSTTLVIKKELNVPLGVIMNVAGIIVNKNLACDIVGTDDDEDILILEVQYEKGQRKAIHEIEDAIAEFLEEDEEEEGDDGK